VRSRSYLDNSAQKFLDNSYLPEDQVLDYRSVEAENKLRLEHKIFNDRSEWDYGINLEHNQLSTRNASFHTFQDGEIQELNYETAVQFVRYGAYGSYSRRLLSDRLDLFAGLRLDGNSYNTEMSNPLNQLSPRLALTYHLAKNWDLSASAGIYYQLPPYPVMTFGSELIDGESVLVNQDNLTYMRSAQTGLGVDFHTEQGYQFKLEGFYKQYDQYPFLLWDQISYANANANYVVAGTQPANSSSEGQAYGLEFQVRQKYRKSYFWMLSYTFVVSQFTGADGQELLSTAWDNRHFANISLGKTFKNNWQAGIRWSLAGGSPYTPYNESLSALRSIWDLNRRGLADYTQLNEARLPVFHSLDVRVDKQWNFQKWSLGIFIDIQNAYQSPIAALPYLTVERDAETQQPLVDPSDPNRYQTKIIGSDTGRIIPALGVLIDF